MGKEARWKNPSLGREFLGKREGRVYPEPTKNTPTHPPGLSDQGVRCCDASLSRQGN